MVAQAVERLVRAMHAAYPEIATEGVRPKEPGLFVGDIAGQRVELLPGKRNSRLFLIEERARGNTAYFRHSFDLLKKGVTPRWHPDEYETRLVLWLTNAAVELEEMARG
jgi:hypothetical protein